MAITVPGSGSSATTSVTIPAHAVGDMIVIMARGTVAPTAPAAGGTVPTWTTPTNQTGANNSVGWRLAYAIATATNHTSGTWTNAAQMHVLVLHPSAGTLGIGNDPAQGGANNTQTMIYPAFTLTAGKLANLVIRYGARGTADTEVRTDGAFAASGVWHTEQPATTPTSAVFSKVVTASEGTFTATPAGVNAAYRCGTVEITETAAPTVHSKAADVTITPAIASVATFFSVFEAAASIALTPAVASSGHKIVERSASITLTPDVASDGEFETPGATTYVDEVTADSPIAWWRLGESAGTTVEEVNNTYDGTYVTGGVKGQTGAIGDGNTAVTFDGVDDYATLTTVGSLGSNILTASVEFWIKTTSATGPKAVLGTLDSGTAMVMQVKLNTRDSTTQTVGSTMFQIRGASANVMRAYITHNIYDGAWHHVVWVIQGNDITHKVWVDGIERTVTASAIDIIGAQSDFDFPIALGAQNSAGTISQFAPVTVDEVAFYTTRLSEARIQAHFNAIEAGPTVHERSASITITPAIASAQQNFSVLERSASVTLTPAVTSAPQTVHLRSASVTLTPAVSSAATFFSILTRSAAVVITPAIATAPQRVLMRATVVTITPAIVSAGQIEGGLVVHERSASVTITPGIASSAAFYSIVECSASVTITPTIASAQMRVVIRQASVTLTPAIASSGAILQIWSRSAAVTITPTISAAGFAGTIFQTHLPLTVEVRDASLTVIHDEGDTSIIFDSSESTVIYDETTTDVAIQGDRDADVPEHLTTVEVVEPVTTVDYEETPRTVEVV